MIKIELYFFKKFLNLVYIYICILMFSLLYNMTGWSYYKWNELHY